MTWNSLSEFLSMGGRAFYVWGSYLVTLAFIVIEIIAVRHRNKVARNALAQAEKMKRLEQNEGET